jgi:hypothetical protein
MFMKGYTDPVYINLSYSSSSSKLKGNKDDDTKCRNKYNPNAFEPYYYVRSALEDANKYFGSNSLLNKEFKPLVAAYIKYIKRMEKEIKKEKKENNLVLLLQRRIYSPNLIREIIKNSTSFDDFFNKVNYITDKQIKSLPSKEDNNHETIIAKFNLLSASSASSA